MQLEQMKLQTGDDSSSNGHNILNEQLMSPTDDELVSANERVDVRSSTVIALPRSANDCRVVTPVAKLAERVRLRRTSEEQREGTELTTIAAEQLVGDMLHQCDFPALYAQVARLTTQLDHTKAKNALLALNLGQTKEHCNR